MRQQSRFRLGVALAIALIAVVVCKLRSHMFQGPTEVFWLSSLA